jgi:gluconate 5-dehydrogenase
MNPECAMAAISSLELFNLAGKRALITGSSRGIGYALAEGLGGAGASIVLNGRDAGALEAAAEKLRGLGFEAAIAAFDVADGAAAEAGIARIEAEQGAIDIVINNAGMQHRAPLEDFPDDAWDKMMKLNIYGVFNVSKAAAKRMIERGAGKIINICSVQSALARPTIAPYVASKGAVANLTKGMCADWAPHGLQVNGIAPGYMKTELTEALVADKDFSAWIAKRAPAGRWGEVRELVGAAIFLSSAASSFVNGHVIYVDGGMTVTL